MRILVVSNLFPPHYVGGYELRCRAITDALQSMGHTVEVLTSDHRLEGVEDGPQPGYEVRRRLKIHGFFGHPWLGISRLQALEKHNHAALLTAIQDFKPDVVHVWNLGGISKSLPLTLQRLNIPTVYDISDHWIAQSLAADVWLDWWNRTAMNPVARLARAAWTAGGARRRLHHTAPTNPVRDIKFQRLYFCSSRLRQITAEAGYDVAHGRVIHCPVNTTEYHGAVKPPTEPLCNLLYAGRLAADKGVLTALQAMKSLGSNCNVHLHVYGRGEPDYEGMLRGYASSHNLPVSFHHARPVEMPEVYRRHDALLFTSEWEEPFALTPLEAMASGLPVIGTTTGGSAELFEDGVNALTYRAGDAKMLSAQILKLSRQPDLRVSVAAAGRREVINRLTLPRIASEIEEYLLDSISEWQPTSLPQPGAR